MTFDAVCALALHLPGVEVGSSYGTPAIKVRSALLARLREDGETMVLKTSFVVREHLLRTEPGLFFVTEHYRDYPTVLVRLAHADPAQLRQLLEDAWRAAAPKRLVRAHDSGAP